MPRSPPEAARSSPTINLKILNGDQNMKKEVVQGVHLTENGISFQSHIKRNDSLIEEHLNDLGQVVFLRFRHISNPPPRLPTDIYNEVTTLHISCLVPMTWIFSHVSILPKLTAITFGSGCFSEEPCEYVGTTEELRRLKMETCPSVTQLAIRVDVERYNQGNEQHIVNHRIGVILDFAQKIFPNLNDMDFHLPQAAESKVGTFRNTLIAKGKVPQSSTLQIDSGVLYVKGHFSRQSSNPAPRGTKNKSNGHSSKTSASKKSKTDVIDLTENDSDSEERSPSSPQVMGDTVPTPPPIQQSVPPRLPGTSGHPAQSSVMPPSVGPMNNPANGPSLDVSAKKTTITIITEAPDASSARPSPSVSGEGQPKVVRGQPSPNNVHGQPATHVRGQPSPTSVQGQPATKGQGQPSPTNVPPPIVQDPRLRGAAKPPPHSQPPVAVVPSRSQSTARPRSRCPPPSANGTTNSQPRVNAPNRPPIPTGSCVRAPIVIPGTLRGQGSVNRAPQGPPTTNATVQAQVPNGIRPAGAATTGGLRVEASAININLRSNDNRQGPKPTSGTLGERVARLTRPVPKTSPSLL